MPGPLLAVLVAEGASPFATLQQDDAAVRQRQERVGRLRAAVAAHDGSESRLTEGGMVAAFSSAVAAVRCAVDMQRAEAQAGAADDLRIGLAAGEPAVQGNDVHGAPVVLAEHLCGVAAPGQILVTEVVRQIAGGSVSAAITSAGMLKLPAVEERLATADVDWSGSTAPQPSTAVSGVQISVVIADDQRLLRSGFRVILDAEHDMRVVGEAADGRAAIDMVRRTRPDVVLMDIQMPELDGLAAAREILADPALESAVLMLTTFDRNEYVYEALRLGASGFLLKDAPADRLLDAIRVVAAGEALLAPSITRRLIAGFADAARPEADATPAVLAELTDRELDVLRLLAAGRSNAEIADELVLGVATVKTHVARVLAKLGLRDRVQAVVLAYESGLVSPERVDPPQG